jgi:hypothetical protein
MMEYWSDAFKARSSNTIPLNIPGASNGKKLLPAVCHPVRRKAAAANAPEMTISSWVDPGCLPWKAFSHSIRGEHGNVR